MLVVMLDCVDAFSSRNQPSGPVSGFRIQAAITAPATPTIVKLSS